MPNIQGVYPIEDVCAVGDQISSTYKGRHVTLFPDNLSHGTNVSVVTKGYPVWFGASGAGVGMPFVTQTAATNLIAQGAIDTEGIWCVDVHATADAGDVAVAVGDRLYVNTTTGVVSKINNIATQLPFGYALGIVTSGEVNRIAVKVHWDPSLDTADTMYKTVTSGTYNYGKQWRGLLEGGESTGVAGYFAAEVDGVQTGNIYGAGVWVEPQDDFDGSGTHQLVAWDEGLYCDSLASEDFTGTWVICQQMAIDIGANPLRLDWFRVNVAASSGTAHCVIAAANPNSVGYLADAVDNAGANKLGNVPLFDIVGVGVCYVEVFSA